jgi:lipooligosaccharide transport system permease protein
MKVETQRLPLFGSGVYHIWKRNYLLFKKDWIKKLMWMAWEPLLVPLMFAYGVGFYVSNIKGFSYIDFFLASLLGISSLTIALSETAVLVFSRLNLQNTYSTIILAPIMPDQILLGEVMWATTKAGFASLIILLVSSILGMFSMSLVPVFFITLLSSFVFALLGVIVATYLNDFEDLKYAISALVLPMALLCDTFFPLDQLPRFFKLFAQIFPLTHVVSAIRDCIVGDIDPAKMSYHILILLLMLLIFLRWSRSRFSVKIIQ